MSEDAWINNIKARNADLFAGETLKMRGTELERLLRVAYRAGGEDMRAELRAASGGGAELFNQWFGR